MKRILHEHPRTAKAPYNLLPTKIKSGNVGLLNPDLKKRIAFCQVEMVAKAGSYFKNCHHPACKTILSMKIQQSNEKQSVTEVKMQRKLSVIIMGYCLPFKVLSCEVGEIDRNLSGM